MQLALTTLALSLAASPWTGLWRIESISGGSDAYHLIVRPGLRVEFYSQDWYQLDVLEPKIDVDKFEAAISQTVDNRNRLTLRRSGDALEGSLTTAAGGGVFLLEHPLKAKRLWNWAPPQGHIWLAEARQADPARVDVLGFVLNAAPTRDFDAFLEFWNRQVEPRYYPFLQRPLYGPTSDLQRRHRLLESLFAKLDSYRGADLKKLEKDSASEDAESDPRGSFRSAVCTAFVPIFDDEGPEIYSMASIKNGYPDGAKLCCGARRFQQEPFFVVPVPAPSEP